MNFKPSLLDRLLDKTILFSFSSIGYYLRRMFQQKETTGVTLSNKVCAITGANAGLGKALAERLAGRGATVYLLCRNEERGKKAVLDICSRINHRRVFLELVDTSDIASINAFAERFTDREKQLDILINNAGVLPLERSETPAGLELTYATNVLGYHKMIVAMEPLLIKTPGSRVINVSSGGAYGAALNLEDVEWKNRIFDGVKAYAETKRAELYLTREWAKRFINKSVLVFAVHPGWADTPGVRFSLKTFHRFMRPILRTPEQGIEAIAWLAYEPKLTIGHSGNFWLDRRIRPFDYVKSTAASETEIKQLWEMVNGDVT
ncbi:MAG: SDR family NAD(P)-dependent oxidoreductase [Calditrichia bacterium]